MAKMASQLIKPSPAQELMALFSTLEPKDQVQFMELLKQSAKSQGSRPGANKGVGEMCRTLIKQGLSNKEVLEMVCSEYNNSNTTYSCVAWYRNDMKQKGLI